MSKPSQQQQQQIPQEDGNDEGDFDLPPREMKDTWEWWTKCTARVHYQTADSTGEPKLIDITIPQQNSRSLPLFRHPLGQAVKDCKTRGEMKACFSVDPTTQALTVIIHMGDMGPRIVPNSYRNRVCMYSIKPTFYLQGTAIRAELPFEMIVDTSALARSHGFQLVKDKDRDDKSEVYAYDHPLLTALQSGQPLENPEWKNVDGLFDPVTNKPIEETELTYNEEPDGTVTFDQLLIDGSYHQVPQDQKGDVPRVQFKFKIVPMRAELEGLNLFSAQSENTIVFDEAVIEYPKGKWPEFATNWIQQWRTQPPIFEQSSMEWIITQMSPIFSLDMMDVDFNPKENIPLIGAEFDVWAKENNFANLAQVFIASRNKGDQKDQQQQQKSPVDHKQLELFYNQLKKGVEHHLNQMHKAHIRQYDDFILSDTSSACGTGATKEQLNLQIVYKDAKASPPAPADVKSAPSVPSPAAQGSSEAQLARQFYEYHLKGPVSSKTILWEEVSKTNIPLRAFKADPLYSMDTFQESGTNRFMARLSCRSK